MLRAENEINHCFTIVIYALRDFAYHMPQYSLATPFQSCFVFKSCSTCVPDLRRHWVCTTSVKTHNEVHVMDSLVSGSKSVNHSLEMQIAKVYGVGRSRLRIKNLSVQQQNGIIDCGLFAVAFAIEVCQGHNPSSVSFDQSQMCTHFYTCLQRGVLSSFPEGSKSQETIPRPKSQVIIVQTNCVCGMPDSYDSNMIECDTCKTWIHFSCAGIKSHESTSLFSCSSCCGRETLAPALQRKCKNRKN